MNYYTHIIAVGRTPHPEIVEVTVPAAAAQQEIVRLRRSYDTVFSYRTFKRKEVYER